MCTFINLLVRQRNEDSFLESSDKRAVQFPGAICSAKQKEVNTDSFTVSSFHLAGEIKRVYQVRQKCGSGISGVSLSVGTNSSLQKM